ncbi:unnamed protein product [Adineta ricciae]|uniref:HAT C-terminal dimerisation domain-containing protein n=1 Tax=Adineta ricciae TaxID=249248 RepID=A0A815TBT9_ADIRI|nr:unnamed protein product [Adineta ricciae]
MSFNVEAASLSSIVIFDSSEEATITHPVSKTARDQFYQDTKTINENKSWKVMCVIYKGTIRGTKGFTSNYNRHIKEFHKSYYDLWQEKLQLNNISDCLYPTNHPRQISLERSIIEDMIIKTGLPLSLVERSDFIKFMTHVDPRFRMMSRRTLTRTSLPGLYSKMMDGLRLFCSNAPFISLTLDMWTDRRQRAFFALTSHAITDTEFKSYVMAFQPVFGNHSAPLLLETYESIINTFNIRSKLVQLVIDSCSNNIAAFRGLVIPGFEYYFQDEEGAYFDENSDVNDGLKGLKATQSSLEKISKIAKLPHSTTLVSQRFEKINVCIPKANKTRWTSQYQTVMTVVNIPPSDLNDILIQTQHRDLCLKPVDYQVLNEFISLLTLFAEATTATQAEKTLSISIVASSVLSICQDLLFERNNIKHSTNLWNCLFESFIARFGGLLEQILIQVDIEEKKKTKRFYDFFQRSCLSVSTIHGRSVSFAMIQQIALEQSILLAHMNGICTTSVNDNAPSSPPLQATTPNSNIISSPCAPKRKSLFSSMDNRIVKKKKFDPFSYIKDEISRCLNDDDMDSMVLIKSSKNYPTLSKLASKFLSIPATSAPVERVFSQSGFFFRQHRASMSRTTLQQLTMLKCNRSLF